jgi:histone acetyltransferase (RNA polymerase elongator complex component)
VTGINEPDPESIDNIVKDYLSWSKPREKIEVSFFGGSFTAIEHELMMKYVKKGRELVEKGVIHTLRCSTRPDAVDETNAQILKENGFETVEIGAQSLSDRLLNKMNRGHLAVDVFKTISVLKKHGIKAGAQFITGYPHETDDDVKETVSGLLKLDPDFIRIYPFVPLPETEIAKEIKSGKVKQINIESVIDRSADLYIEAMKNKIPVIRVGLPQSEDVPDIYPHNLSQVVIQKAIEKLAENGEKEFTLPEKWITSFNMAKRKFPEIKRA